MSHHQSKDPAFKLFGRKIPVPDSQIPAIPPSKNNSSETTEVETQGVKEDNSVAPDKCSASVKCKEESQAQVTEVQGAYKLKEEGVETDNTDQEKVFKKPDKVLPCPRCNSLETKFCYFNNYNVNQPRHFCKNCQRYWTAGGTMRNVPIGAGRRKNKHLASQYRHIIVSPDGMPIARIENSESANHQLISSVESETTLRTSAGNGMVLKFGPEAPLCESMDTVLNLGEKKGYAEVSTVNARENGEESSLCGSTVTASSVRGNEIHENLLQKDRVGLPGSPSQLSAGPAGQPLHCYPVPPWVVPWNPGWNNAASVAPAQNSSSQACMPNGSDLNQTQWSATPVLAVPGFCPPNIPLQFVPAAYWSCMPMWTSGTGNVSLNASNGCLSPSSSTSTSCCSGNGSPTLGKHSRDLNFIDEEKAEKSVLIPKTLRIDVPNQASKSPLWASLGLQTDLKDPILKGAVFKTFETKAEGKAHIPDAAHILEANPAALSRSHTFQEST